MQDIRAVWPCLVKRRIACFETLAQLALLQAAHSHIGGGRYSFSMPSGTDNSATEASLNKLFTTSWPLQLFVQLTAFWAHAHNPSPRESRTLRCQAGASSCVRLTRPDARNTWQPLPPTGIATRHRRGSQNIWLHLSAASQQAALTKISSP